MIKRNKGKSAMVVPFKFGGQSSQPSSSSGTAGNERPRPSSPAASPSTHPAAAPRIDLLEEPSAPVPETRRSADGALLTLQLSATSFLETRIDDVAVQRPLYVISSRGRDTQIVRLNESRPNKVAHIHWPKHIPLEGPSRIRVQVSNGRWREAEEFLKYGSLFTSRKFAIPHYPHSLKWKRAGSAYNCTTAGAKGNVAILDPSSLSSPPRIRVFQTLVEPDPTRPSLDYASIPTILLDHLVTTALLLASSADEWKTVSSLPTRSNTRSSGRSGKSSEPTSPDHWMDLVGSSLRSSASGASGSGIHRPASPSTSIGGESAHPSSSGASEALSSPSSTNLVVSSRLSIDETITSEPTPRPSTEPTRLSSELALDTQNIPPGRHTQAYRALRQNSASSDHLSTPSTRLSHGPLSEASPLDTPTSAASTFPPPSVGTPAQGYAQPEWDAGLLASGPAPLPSKLASELTRAHTYVAVAPQVQNQAESDSDSDGGVGGRVRGVGGIELQSLTSAMQRATFFPTLPAHRHPPPGDEGAAYDAPPPAYDTVVDCAAAPPPASAPAPVLAAGPGLSRRVRVPDPAHATSPLQPRPATSAGTMASAARQHPFPPVPHIAHTAPLRPRTGESRQLPPLPGPPPSGAGALPLKTGPAPMFPRNEAPLPPLPPGALSGNEP